MRRLDIATKMLTSRIESTSYNTMLFTARTTLRLLITLGAAMAINGQSYSDEGKVARGYDDDYSLSARGYYDDFSARSIEHSFHARGSADGGDFVLSARDLGKLGVRADDISHVLVLRMNQPLSPQERARLQGIITSYQTKIREIKPKIETAKNAKRTAEREKPKDAKKVERLANAYSDLVQMKEGYEHEIETTEALLH